MEDRLSTLPDEVIHLILSFLKTKLAVQTCVLSKRWRSLWTGILTLHFKESSFSNYVSFIKFLNHVFLHKDHSKTILQFKISSSYISDYTISRLVLDFLVKHDRDIQDLVISSYIYQWEFLSPSYWDLFHTWDSLKTLSLEYICIPINVEYGFVSLMSLHLYNCELVDDYDYSLDRILAGNIKITAPQLKEFKMSYLFFEDPVDPHFKMILSFPKLLSFCFEGNELLHISFLHHPVLQKLTVDYDVCLPSQSDYKHLINIFGAIGGAKFVTLSEKTICVLSKVPDVAKGKQPPFCEIQELKIIVTRIMSEMGNKFSFTVPSCVITYLLSKSPSSKGVTLVYQDYEKNITKYEKLKWPKEIAKWKSYQNSV
ncbi:F-box/LRR-repeat protein 25-like [Senna tora]|uniref:F-box/LRR-repeat protein 25-like n=1 Tax=Senna tora TaxID=362788 RepID=A0A835CH16_9FABA|nr:F-box/LRR-repeat protein 25-like [Senna tora]